MASDLIKRPAGTLEENAPDGTQVFQVSTAQLIAACRSSHTRRAYTSDVKYWLDFCARGGIDPLRATLGDAATFRDWLFERKLSDATVLRCLRTLSSLYNALLAVRVATGNPFHPRFLKHPKVSSSVGKTPAISEEDAERVLDKTRFDRTLRGVRDYAILRLLYDTGLRRSSVGVLERKNLRYEPRETGRVVIANVWAKGGKTVEVELPSITADALEQWLFHAEPSPWVFYGVQQNHDQHISLSTINLIVRLRLNAAGVEGYSPHSFRATFVTSGYALGLPGADVQAAVHHSDEKITQLYNRAPKRGQNVATVIAEAREAKKKGT